MTTPNAKNDQTAVSASNSTALLAVVTQVDCYRPIPGRFHATAKILLYDPKGGKTQVEIPVTEIVDKLESGARYLVKIEITPMADNEVFPPANTAI